jgi:hypothetical protein
MYSVGIIIVARTMGSSSASNLSGSGSWPGERMSFSVPSARRLLEPLLDDLHVQEAQEPAAEAEAEGVRGLGEERQRRVGERERLEGVAQLLVVAGARRIEVRVDHVLGLFVALEHLDLRALRERQRVTDPNVSQALDVGDEVPHLSGGELITLLHLGREATDLERLVLRAGAHHLHQVALLERAVEETQVDDDAAVLVEDRVEDQSLERRFGVPRRRRDALDHAVEDGGHAEPGLG